MNTNSNSFYNDRKFCPCCEDYVAYLASPVQSYCIQCAGEVRIMSPEDWATFNHDRAKSPVRRKGKGPASASQAKQTSATQTKSVV
jgi:hypothetical protein